MRSRTVWLSVFLHIFLTAYFAVAINTSAYSEEFKATLTGSKVVPPVKSKAKGEATFRLFKGERRMLYRLSVTNIEDVTAAHIHKGKKGENGPPVVVLYSGSKKSGKYSGMLAEGIVTDYDLIGPLKGGTLEALVKMIYDGEAYVNVHTKKYPDGEIRGQIK